MVDNLISGGGGGGGKGGGGGGRAAKEAPNSLKSKAYAKIVEVLCEGEIEGVVGGARGIYLDDVPLQNEDGTFNFSDVSYEVRTGTLDQPITKIGSTTEVTNQVGTEIKKATPVEYTVTAVDADSVRIAVQLPSLQKQNTSNGDINGTEVSYSIEYKPSGGSFISPPITQVDLITLSTDTDTGHSEYNGTLLLESSSLPASVVSAATGIKLVDKYQKLTYSVEYSTNAGSSWSVIKAGSGVFYPVLLTSIASVIAGGKPPEPIVWAFSGDKSLTYKFRVVVTQGSVVSHQITAYNMSNVVTVIGKTNSAYIRDTEFNLTGTAPWIVKVTRLTDDSTSSALQNKTFLSSVTTLFKEKFSYPATAYAAISIDAEQFSSIPTRAYDVKLLKVKVPVNYDPIARTYSGVWDGTFKIAWTDNPAWCYYDLLVNKRYGVGDRVDPSKIDKWSLYQIAQYCDELVDNGDGVAEPRFTCNLVIQSREEAYKVIQDMSSVFAGISYWGSTRDGFSGIIPVQDSPTETYSYVYNNTNVEDGAFNYSSGNVNTRYNVVYVTYNDPVDNYAQKVVYVPDTESIVSDGFINSTDVVAFGCTSRGQAYRLGRRILFTNRYENEVVSFTVGSDGILASVGSVIKICDNLRTADRIGGRVVSKLSSTQVKLDSAVTIAPSLTYTLTLIDGTGVPQEFVVTTPAGITDTLTVSTALPTALAVNSLFILSSDNITAATYKVVSVVESEGAYSVSAIKYNASKYSYVDSMDSVSFPPDSVAKVVPDAPTGFVATDALYVNASSSVSTRLDLSWQPPSSASAVKGYVLEWKSEASNNWQRLPQTSYPAASLLEVTDGALYSFRVWSINALGVPAAEPLEATYTPAGKALPPSNVVSFTNTRDVMNGVLLSWVAVPDVDIDLYEIRLGASWETSSLVGRVKGTNYVAGFSSGTYLIKAVDTSGNYSAAAASSVVGAASIGTPTVSYGFESNIVRVTWTQPSSTYLIDSYDVLIEGQDVRTVKGTTLDIEVVWSGSKVISVRARDVSGDYGSYGTVTVSVTVPSQPTVVQQVIDNNVLLRWTDSRQTLPITSYEVRRGSSWNSATVVGKVQAQFSTIFESVAGTFTYLIKAYDTAGNESAVGSVVAVVNQPPDYALQFDQDSAKSGTLNSAVLDANKLLLPVNTTETWTTHFTSRGWSTPQDQITAGYPIFIQPNSSTGYYEELIDYGTVLAGTKITVTPETTIVAGNPTYSVTISVRKLLSDPWTDYANTMSVYVTDFRYVKYRITVATDTLDDLLQIDNINIRFDVKLKNDAGSAVVNSADSGGTTINFNIPFVDVQSITVTPKGTTPLIAIYDFTDVPNPTSFKVLLFNTAGVRQSGEVSWSVKGV